MTWNQKKAVYAGSFDPITNGHLWVIKEGIKLFEKLIVAIGINTEKKYTFSWKERHEMLQETTEQWRHCVWIDGFENKFLVNYAKSIGAQYILRGIRDEEDYKYERGIMHINGDIAPEIVTVFLMPPRELAEVSSSMVKGLVGPEGWQEIVKKYVPLPVYEKFLKRGGL